MAKSKPRFTRVAQLKTAEDFTAYMLDNGIKLPFDATLKPDIFKTEIKLRGSKNIGNRFCILPMEGWDGTKDGKPTIHTQKRWEKFAISGAKLLFGCEAVAISHEAKANPRQLVMNTDTFESIKELRELTEKIHLERFGGELVMGLQLTHSGRFCKPNDNTVFESKVVYAHPILDEKFKLDIQKGLLSDEDIEAIVHQYVDAAILAQKAGFDFIDIKHCHGYLGHEFLSAKTRPGKYGGSFENRTRYFREIAEGIKKACPGLGLGMRLSAMDFVPFKKSIDDIGEPYAFVGSYDLAFGSDSTGLNLDLSEAIAFLKMAHEHGVEMVCITAGSPYYNPHVTRPALFPPSDGYTPPEDPLEGVLRHIELTAALKKACPELVLIGSGYSYLQEWLPNVAQKVLVEGMADSIGIGRMVLSYPGMPADIMNGDMLTRNLICRTFSDCTTAPRNGMISGCYPLDPYYKTMPEAVKLKELKHE